MGRSKNESLYDASPLLAPNHPHSLPAWPVGAGMRNQGIQPLLSQPIWPKRSPLCSKPASVLTAGNYTKEGAVRVTGLGWLHKMISAHFSLEKWWLIGEEGPVCLWTRHFTLAVAVTPLHTQPDPLPVYETSSEISSPSRKRPPSSCKYVESCPTHRSTAGHILMEIL